ncbi:OLC1v1002669C1 [Oldenlandia corymbosa var. corymbosa]|uniref:OLC1v1002669C1 n=1 Tax=Oldenlandia corymbosa var. corymbosa TaxID=529605 RepID=A0AAV1D9V3_OLDCO|nr:OLC1v1002669C1 [Oldenlandia corymbosa var. corymbosa]
MATASRSCFLLFLIAFSAFAAEPISAVLVKQQPLVLKYHKGPLLKGNVLINLIWYGKFTPAERSVIVDFLSSLNSARTAAPSVAAWWQTTEKYKGGGATKVVLGKQILDENYSLGKSLTNSQLVYLAAKGGHAAGAINVVLTAKDVYVAGFCSRCGTHGSITRPVRMAYAWVGNSESQCPGQCAWPFHQPIYGPQTRPLVAPNGVGVDGMIINLATVLAGAFTNPYNSGYFQGPATAPLEAVSACTGMFGSGSYPGYPGKLLVDKTTGASFNAYGVSNRKFCLPAIWDPETSACSTLV